MYVIAHTCESATLFLSFSMTCSIGLLFRHPPKGYLNHRLPHSSDRSARRDFSEDSVSFNRRLPSRDRGVPCPPWSPCLFKVLRAVQQEIPLSAGGCVRERQVLQTRDVLHFVQFAAVRHGFCSIFYCRDVSKVSLYCREQKFRV